MTINDWAKAQEFDEFECLNCGRTLSTASDDKEMCKECCPHENTYEELTRTTCEDCGCKVE